MLVNMLVKRTGKIAVKPHGGGASAAIAALSAGIAIP
jgi:hypothetical protein